MTKRKGGRVRSLRLRGLIHAATQQGWAVSWDGRGHVRLTSPAGKTVWISATANDNALGHHYENTRALARRAGLDVSKL